MRVTEIRNGFMVLDHAGPGYVGKLRNGEFVCHWSFLPRLWADTDGAVEFDPGMKDKLGRLARARAALLAAKTDVRADGMSGLFGSEQPFEYQWAGINFMRAAKGVLLADDVGLGKTVQTIGVVLDGFESETIRSAIVVCPSSVKFQWRDEFLRFANGEKFPDLESEIVVVHGDARNREALYAEPWSVLIMTYQIFLRDQKLLGGYGDVVDCLVLDEANAIKNRTTKTAKAVKKYSRTIPYRLALTATPLENRLHDLYSICEWLDLSIFPGMKWFEGEYCKIVHLKVKKGGYTIRIPKVTGYRNLADARKRMEPVYVRRTFREVGAQLPEVVSTTLRLELTKEQRTMYGEIAKRIHGAKDEERMAVIGQIVRLREVCDSTGLIGGPHHSSKMDELTRLLDELPETEKIVVFSEFRKMTDWIVKKLSRYAPLYINGGTEDVQRQVIRTQFAGETNRVLVMTSAGERGLNLQVAGLLVNVDLPYNPARLKQRIGRLWRIGSEHEHVRVINMVCEDTFEQRVLDTLNRKERLFDVLFEPDGIDRLGDPINGMSASQLKKMI